MSDMTKKLDVEEFQLETADWHKRNFTDMSPMRQQLNLTEEVGELSRAIIKMDQGIRGSREEWWAEAYKEVGDVAISLSNVANALGIDLEFAIMDRWDEVKKRNWRKDQKGHGIPDEN